MGKNYPVVGVYKWLKKLCKDSPFITRIKYNISSLNRNEPEIKHRLNQMDHIHTWKKMIRKYPVIYINPEI